jgi:type III pantothenate kinase
MSVPFPSTINNNGPILPHAGTDMKYLLIDNSNTRTKFQLADAEHLHDWTKWIPTADVSVDVLGKITKAIHFDAVLICSVVPEKSAIMQEFFTRSHPLHVVSCDSAMDLAIDYPNPRQIGADRLANAIGVLEKYQVPAIVIDFGTAVTFDVISAQRAYCGGVIAPGLGAMNEYLHRKTALLPLIELAEPAHAVGKSTQEAMMAGAVYGYRGLVKEILLKLREEVEGDVTIIATGGDAALIAQGVEEIHLVDPQITLEGLRHLAIKNL